MLLPDGYYPTPDDVIRKMLQGVTRDLILCGNILDPSAGTGNILEYIEKHYSNNWGRFRGNLFAIEISPEFRAILSDKKFKVIDSDFLLYKGTRQFDIILMNPEWAYGAEHVLHAFDISNGALIKALLNAETINNPFTPNRKRLLHLIEKHGGTIEHLGQCFKDAERPTLAEAVLITLQDKSPSKRTFDFQYEATKPLTLDEEDLSSGLAPVDIFESYEAQFEAAINAFQEMLVAKRKLEFYANSFMEKDVYSSRLSKMLSDAFEKSDYNDTYNHFSEGLNEAAWNELFNKTKLKTVTTTGVSQEIHSLQKSQGQMAFTAKNMTALFETLFLSRENIMLECIDQVFEKLTKHYQDNREYVPGWKTNSAYKVGKRFILPNMMSVYSTTYIQERHLLDDIDKAMCFLAGEKLDESSTMYTVLSRFTGKREYIGKWLETRFFQVKMYKNRNFHFQWQSEELREKFNMIVARKRKWDIPENLKRGFYE